MADLIERDAVAYKVKSCITIPADSEWDSGYNTAMAEAKQYIQNAPAVNRWIPVEDALPEIDKDVLVYAVRKDGLGDAVTAITQYINHIWFGHRIDTEPYWRDPWQYFHSDYEITHWMPLPEPPEKE